jgi:hypothetical protein
MGMYMIKITEIMEREIHLEADSEVEAVTQAMNKYQDRKYVLFPGRHVSTEFNIEDKNKEMEKAAG